MGDATQCTVYIDEAGDLGVGRGTQWFVLSGVIVDNADEPQIRTALSEIRSRLNIKDIHLRKVNDYFKRAYITREVSVQQFTYVNIVIDTSKLKVYQCDTTYNYARRMLLERVSWYMRDTKRTGNVVLSSRGTNRDNDLIEYIKTKLLTYDHNTIASSVYNKITAKAASQWDMLQLADVCATTTFTAYETNSYGFRVPCFMKSLSDHLYKHNGELNGYGIKYYSQEMHAQKATLACEWVCRNK